MDKFPKFCSVNFKKAYEKSQDWQHVYFLNPWGFVGVFLKTVWKVTIFSYARNLYFVKKQ